MILAVGSQNRIPQRELSLRQISPDEIRFLWTQGDLLQDLLNQQQARAPVKEQARRL
jgi:hypothetical protein